MHATGAHPAGRQRGLTATTTHHRSRGRQLHPAGRARRPRLVLVERATACRSRSSRRGAAASDRREA